VSSIVVNPSRKAENSIYLVFSAVFVTFIFYLAEGLNTGTEFVPDLVVVLAISSLIASGLFYSSIDEIVLHWRLKNRSRQEKSVTKLAKFNILTQYLLGSYAIVTRRVRPPKDEVCDAVDSVLEGKDLDTEIWKLRGAFWLLLSLIPSGLIICSILKWAATFVFIVALIIIIGIAVIVPSIEQYKQTSQYVTALAQFQWFDELLTATRMTETTATKTVTNLNIALNGLSESIYRGVRGTQMEQPKLVKDVPEIVRPIIDKKPIDQSDRREIPVSFRGTISEDIHVQRESKRKFNSLLAEEAIWLRQLVQMSRWKIFSIRFLKLKSDINANAKINQSSLLNNIINEWLKCMNTGKISHSFSELRRLTFHMNDLDILLDDDKAVIRALLKPDEKEIIVPIVAFAYFKFRIPDHAISSRKISAMFLSYANTFKEKFINDYGPPEEPLDFDSELGFLEWQIEEGTGRTVNILYNPEKVVLDAIKNQDYTLEG